MKWLRFSAPVATPNKKKTCLFLLSTLLGLFGLIWSNDRRLRRFRPRLHPIDTTDRIVVLMYTDYWDHSDEWHGFKPTDCVFPKDLPPETHSTPSDWCILSQDRGDAKKAGILLFHSYDVRGFDFPTVRVTDQPWVYYTMEPWTNELSWNKDFVTSDALMGVFDLSATYDLSSDVPQTYETRTEDFVRVLRAPVRDLSAKQSLGNGQSPVLWIATNCNAPSGRHHYIKELMNHIPVDSYGKCLHTKDVPTGFPGRYNSSDLSYLSTLIKEYKFYLAVENTNCPDYVSEKYFNALRSGYDQLQSRQATTHAETDSVLPIVDGPPGGYKGFAPTNHSVIELDDFPNPRDLADYLKKLDADDSLYRSYFDYKAPKNAPFEESFQKRWAEPGVEQDRGWCGLCREAARSVQKRKRAEGTSTWSETRPRLLENIRPQNCASPGKWQF